MAQVYRAPIISQETDVYNNLLGSYDYYATGPFLRRNDYLAVYNDNVYMVVAFEDRLRAFLASQYPFTEVEGSIYGETTLTYTNESSLDISQIPNRYAGGFGGGLITTGSTPNFTSPYSYYSTNSAAITALLAAVPSIRYIITYRLTNCTAPSAPTEAIIGETVTVPFQFTSGYGIVNPLSDVYVTNNGVVVPSQYSNGVLTFTMPDPSQ